MKDTPPGDKIDFTLTESAREYLSNVLPGCVKRMSDDGFVLIFSYTGGGRTVKNGKTVWEFRGAAFGLGGQRPEVLQRGKYFDLLGYPVWIGEIDQLLLKGRVLDFMAVGAPEPEKRLVIENAPENFFETVLSENSACRWRHGQRNEKGT